MKKKNLFLLGALLISALSTFLFTSCDKDTWCYIDVTVVDPLDSNKVAPNAWVKIQYVKENETDPSQSSVGTIADTGQCDANGIYKTKFAAPAIMTVQARINVPDDLNNKFYYRQGEKSVRIKSGETVTTTVKVDGPVTLGRADWQDIN